MESFYGKCMDEFECWWKEAVEGVTLSLLHPLSTQVGRGTRCEPGPTWMVTDLEREAILVVNMRGPCDAWPFHQKVSLTLINQKETHDWLLLPWSSLKLVLMSGQERDEHCIRLPHVYLYRTLAEWRVCKRCMSRHVRPSQYHTIKLFMCKVNNVIKYLSTQDRWKILTVHCRDHHCALTLRIVIV